MCLFSVTPRTTDQEQSLATTVCVPTNVVGGDAWMLQSANAGFGDRADPSKWSEVEGPLKVVLFEGWMLGFEPEDEAAVTAVDPQVSLCLLPLSERILNKV
jgi:hypothetical protein